MTSMVDDKPITMDNDSVNSYYGSSDYNGNGTRTNVVQLSPNIVGSEPVLASPFPLPSWLVVKTSDNSVAWFITSPIIIIFKSGQTPVYVSNSTILHYFDPSTSNFDIGLLDSDVGSIGMNTSGSKYNISAGFIGISTKVLRESLNTLELD